MKNLPPFVSWLGLGWGLIVAALLFQILILSQRSAPLPARSFPPAGAHQDAGEVLAEARRVEAHTESQISLIVTLMEVFIGVVGLVAIILTGIGLREWKHVSEKAEQTLQSAEDKIAATLQQTETRVQGSLRQVEATLRNAEAKTAETLRQTEERVKESLDRAETDARLAQEAAGRGSLLVSGLEQETEMARQKADEATRLAEENSRQIKEMRTSLVEAWSGEIHRAFQDLPSLEAEWEYSFKVRELPPEDRIRIIDLDGLCVICDRLKIPGDLEILIDSFLQMGRYWRFVDEYPRAMVRVDRALALANAEELERRCRLHRARIFIQWATYKPDRRRNQFLASAKEDLDRVRKIQGGDDASTLFEDAWIADVEERYDEALELWARARAAEVGDGKPEGLWRYGYNMACTLARADRLEEAMGELRKLVGAGREWIELASGDPDLERLKAHPEWGKELEALLEQARQAISG